MTVRKLTTIERKLAKQHGAVSGPKVTDPFQLVLWEQVGYLADDEKRGVAFGLLKRRVGLSPKKIVAAPLETLEEIAKVGGSIAAKKRAERMQASAHRVLEEWKGSLKRALVLPVAQATRAFTKFPMIGKPGAEKILLLTRSHPVLALDSNCMRVLLRLGYGTEDARYEKSYASVRAATAAEEREDYDWLISLHGRLRRHGQEICRRNRPECSSCSLTSLCAYFEEQAEA